MNTKKFRVYELDSRVLEDEDGEIVADVHTHIGEEDARRLAACWNACLGISPEQIEQGGLTLVINTLRLAASEPGTIRLAELRYEARRALRAIGDSR